MRKSLPPSIERLVCRPDGSARFGRINAVLIALILVVAGVIPAFATGSSSIQPRSASPLLN
ncbi:MAG: hypothetical protein ACOYN3_05885, partial [Acidimicrobiia bacterium]